MIVTSNTMRVSKVKRLLMLQSLIFSFLTLAECKMCVPAEEGKAYSVSCSTSDFSDQTQIFWKISTNGSDVAVCPYNTSPTCRGPSPYFHASSSKTEESEFSSIFTVVNFSRPGPVNINSFLCYIDQTLQYSCSPLPIFARPEEPVCEHELVNNATDLRINCRTDKVFPQAMCHFQRRVNQTQSLQNVTSTVSYFHTKFSHNPEYYKSECSVTIPISHLGPGSHSFSVIVYPNIITGIQYGKINIIQGINFSYPSASITDCPANVSVNQNYIVEGTIITCKCSRTDNSYFPATVTMSVNTGESASSQESILLAFIARRNQELMCTVTNSLKWTSSVIYKSQIAFLSFQAFPSADRGPIEENAVVTFTCEVEGNPRQLSLSLQKRGTMSTSTSGTLQLSKTMTCKDTGVYLCTPEMLGDQANSSLEINVLCSQRLAKPEEQDKVYNGYVSETFSISLSVYGYPAPTSFILSPATRAVPREAYIVGYLNQEPPYGVVVLQFNRLDESYVQNYTLYVTNTQGSLVYKFSIRKMATAVEEKNFVSFGAFVGSVVAGLLVIILLILIIIFKRRGQINKGEGQKDRLAPLILP